jgi:hypothetical protein
MMQDAREATTRPSSRISDGSSIAMNANQTEGTRMQSKAMAATRSAISMTNFMCRAGREGEGRGGGKWGREAEAGDPRGLVVSQEKEREKKGELMRRQRN